MAQIHAREIGTAKGDLVHQLLMKLFGARSSAEQRFIVQQPRPRSSLNLKTRDRVFQDGWYDKKDWLCGSQGRKALFVGRVYYLGLVFPEAGRLQDIQTCTVFYRIHESTLNQTPTWNHTKSGKHLICTRESTFSCQEPDARKLIVITRK